MRKKLYYKDGSVIEVDHLFTSESWINRKDINSAPIIGWHKKNERYAYCYEHSTTLKDISTVGSNVLSYNDFIRVNEDRTIFYSSYESYKKSFTLRCSSNNLLWRWSKTANRYKSIEMIEKDIYVYTGEELDDIGECYMVRQLSKIRIGKNTKENTMETNYAGEFRLIRVKFTKKSHIDNEINGDKLNGYSYKVSPKIFKKLKIGSTVVVESNGHNLQIAQVVHRFGSGDYAERTKALQQASAWVVDIVDTSFIENKISSDAEIKSIESQLEKDLVEMDRTLKLQLLAETNKSVAEKLARLNELKG